MCVSFNGKIEVTFENRKLKLNIFQDIEENVIFISFKSTQLLKVTGA